MIQKGENPGNNDEEINLKSNRVDDQNDFEQQNAAEKSLIFGIILGRQRTKAVSIQTGSGPIMCRQLGDKTLVSFFV